MIRRSILGLIAFALLAPAAAAPASAATPWWRINTEVVPTHLPPAGEGEIAIAVANLGDSPVNSSEGVVTITDKLPPGVKATALIGQAIKGNGRGAEVTCPSGTPTPPLTCSFVKGTVFPYERLRIRIKVKTEEPPGTVTSLPNEATVQGGPAASAASTQPLTVTEEETPFGVQGYELTPTNENGTPAAQAGAHPFQLTTSLVLNQTIPPNAGAPQPVQLPKDLSFTLPPGLIGNPNAATQCSEVDFDALVFETNLCPPSSVVGVATVTADEPSVKVITATVPVFNLVPAQGEPARFGFEAETGKIPIVIDTSVRSGGSYAVVATVHNATQVAGVLSSQVTLWGVPGDPRHNSSRGWECVAGGSYEAQIKKPCPTSPGASQQPFLTMPTSCPANPAAEPLRSSLEADSWATPGVYLTSEFAWMNGEGAGLSTENCGALPFTPELAVASEQNAAATPTKLTAKVRLPQQSTLEANGLGEADVRESVVTLPAGVTLSPSAANLVAACPEGPVAGYEGIGFTGFEKFSSLEAPPGAATFTPTFRFTGEEVAGLPPSCPETSKVGAVSIRTPLLANPLKGSVYLASPAPNEEPGRNPFGSLVALYIVARDPVSGVLVKLAGHGEIEEASGQIRTVFADTPQVPFEELTLELFGGPRASVSTPAVCGGYAAEGVFTPWSGTGPVDVSSKAEELQVSSGVGGSSCAGAPLAFSPGFLAQSTSSQAGAFTGFQVELSHRDGDQALRGVSMHLPGGVAALLSKVELCGQAQANSDSCPAASEIGQATAFAGLGPEPYVETGGRVYVTGPYDGAPFGLEIVTPAVAGPFNLGLVTVRARLLVNPENASVTIASDPLPTQLRGIPLQLKRVLVDVDRPSFEFNPTSCSPMNVEAALTGAEGATSALSSRFQVGGCQSMPFAPKLTASAVGHGSKADGTTFKVIVSSGGVNAGGVAQSGIAKVDLQLPKQLSSRLPTLQKACTEAAFNANPASCDEGSVIGTATIHTPVLRSPLSGPAYLVSHGNAAFPDVEFVLQGEGITLVLDGKTQIKKQITYSKFESTPDAPFTTFETVLPAGPHGVLTPNVAESKRFDLCGETLTAPTTIVGHNGATIQQNTKITIAGCAAVKSAKAKKLTRAQKLARALRACRSRYKHAKAKTRRIRCEKRARKAYAARKAVRTHKQSVASARRRH